MIKPCNVYQRIIKLDTKKLDIYSAVIRRSRRFYADTNDERRFLRVVFIVVFVFESFFCSAFLVYLDCSKVPYEINDRWFQPLILLESEIKFTMHETASSNKSKKDQRVKIWRHVPLSCDYHVIQGSFTFWKDPRKSLEIVQRRFLSIETLWE